jgi:hypothetical protein
VSLAPDGTRALFLTRAAANAPLELHAAAVDVPLSEYGLSVPVPGGVDAYSVDPASRFAVFRENQGGAVWELFHVPLDGTQAPRKLNGPLVSGGSVSLAPASFQVGPGENVVYLADETVNDVVELYSATILSLPPKVRSTAGVVSNGELAIARRKLSPTPVAGGDVTGFVLSPEGRTVVYRADQVLDERFELFSVPVRGNAPPVKLNATPVAGGDVSSGFQISPDGLRVVYLADQTTNDRIELWSVPIHGGTPVRLNAPMSGGNDIKGFAISPDGAQVVYFGQQLGTQVDLFLVPIAGGQAPVELATPPDRDVTTVRISPRGFAVYTAFTSGNDALFAAPLDGSGALQRVSPIPVDQGFIMDYQLTPDGDRVVYRADQFADERFELFMSFLTPPFRRAP